MDFVAATDTGQINLSLGQRMDLLRATPVGGRFGPLPNMWRRLHWGLLEPGFPICLPRMVPLYTREPPSARNFVRRPIGRLQRLSPQPAVTWKRLEPLLSGHFSDTAPHVCRFFAMRASLH